MVVLHGWHLNANDDSNFFLFEKWKLNTYDLFWWLKLQIFSYIKIKTKVLQKWLQNQLIIFSNN